MIETETEIIKYQGELKQIFSEIYQHCESKRIERILWINLDCLNQPYKVNIENFSITEFAKTLIDLTEELNEENFILIIFKKLYNTLVSDDNTKATILESKTRSDYNFIAQIDMDLDSFLEKFDL